MTRRSENLREYRRRRDLDRSTEPKGGSRRSDRQPIFVIQKHAASSLHYDLRLEIDGVLKSWAVPRGPSTDPREKRLALPTEDHPLEYADFEGTIPPGHYGAGAVLVWDRGTYRNLKRDEDDRPVPMRTALEHGQVEVWLNGQKLHGGFALIRTGRGEQQRWLLVKMNDDGADARRNPVSTQPESVVSGRTMDQLRRDTSAAEKEAGDAVDS